MTAAAVVLPASGASAHSNQSRSTTRNWAASSPERSLHYGHKSNRVMHLQNMLQRWGYYAGATNASGGACATSYSTVVDGDFGSCTKSALQNFQRAHNLTADGVAGPLTMNVMQRGQPGEPHSAESICTDVNAPAYHICYYEHPSHPTNNWAAVYDLGPSGSHAGIYFWHHTKECWTAAKAFETGACAQYNQEGGRVQAAGTEVVARPSRTD